MSPVPSAAAASAAASPAKPIRLNRNESPYGPCEKANEAMRDAVGLANRYPGQELDDLRAGIATLNGVKPDQITLGCGSGDILRIAAETFLGREKSLVMATPTFEAIAGYARAGGAEIRTVPLTKRYAHDLDAMIKRTDASTGLIYICNPNNPTGSMTPSADLESFFAKVPESASVLIDEAYYDFVLPTSSFKTWLARATSDSRLIVTRTLSKVYGLAGLRVGYAVASTETSKRLAQRRLAMGVNILAARAATAAIQDQGYVKRILARVTDDRQEFYNQANARMLRSLDSVTNFVMLRTPRPGTEVAEQLEEKGVLVASGYSGFDNYVRVSLGTPQDMAEFWRAWDAFMPHGM
ncbi:MAG TPA: histidinol-phosphate transaminase [Candidatus Acidoferrum sp.]|nr:histidinol-phosphate transaminase [Candidatus Acidoferrum sp.]